MFKIDLNLQIKEIDVQLIYKQVAQDVISEIKRLIKDGKNIHNVSLMSKIDGARPDFYDSGLLLNSLDFKVDENGFEIFVNNADRSNVLSYIQNKNNWIILDSSKYIDSFIESKMDFYLQKQLDTI